MSVNCVLCSLGGHSLLQFSSEALDCFWVVFFIKVRGDVIKLQEL